MEAEPCFACTRQASAVCVGCGKLLCKQHQAAASHGCAAAQPQQVVESPVAAQPKERNLDPSVVNVNDVKVFVFGDAASGKSSLVRALLGQPFAPYYATTQSADIYRAELHQDLYSQGWRPAVVFDKGESLYDQGWRPVNNPYSNRPGRLVSIARDSHIACLLHNWSQELSERAMLSLLRRSNLAAESPQPPLARMNDPTGTYSDPQEASVGNDLYAEVMEVEYPQAAIVDLKIDFRNLQPWVQSPLDTACFCWWNSPYDPVFYVQFELFLVCWAMMAAVH